MDTLLAYIQAGIKQVNKGVSKYGTTVDENKNGLLYWIDHLVEELTDALFYLLRIRKELTETLRVKDSK